MSMQDSRKQAKYEKKLKTILSKRGYSRSAKIVDTLQGSIWRSIQENTNKRVVIKITSKELTSESIIIVNGMKHKIDENVLTERNILKHLSNDGKCPKSIVKYIDFMKSNVNYYLIMEDGGHSLFDFNVKVHEYIECGKIDISEWHKLVKIIFKQMMQCIDYIHSKNVCHFDISLENFLISDIDVTFNENNEKLIFCYDETNDVQIKLADFGLAHLFQDIDGNIDDEKASHFQSNKFCGKTCYQSPEIAAKQTFDAAQNDIYCLGVCLFMMITGNAPFRSSIYTDKHFKLIMNENGNISKLINKWNKNQYINQELIQLFQSIFQFEDKRINIKQIKQCKWLNT